jgi:hypothetical protein
VRRRLILVLAVTALHAAITGAAASRAFFYVNVGTAQRVFGGSNGEANLFEDVRAYHEYASRAMHGETPYRDYMIEYPIGAFPLFLAPRLFVAGLHPYRWAFAAEMIAFDGLIVWLIAKRAERMGQPSPALLWYTLGIGALGALPIARFDLAPTAMAFASVMAWEAGRAGSGGMLAGGGGLMKVFPAIVLAPGLMLTREGRLRAVLAFGAVSVLGVCVWLLVGREGMLASLRYHSGRGLELGSIYGGVLIIAAKLLGMPLSHDFNHSSVELIMPWAPPVAAIAPAIQVAALGWVLWRFRRGGIEDLPRAAGASLLAFAVFGKVLSPQYALWLLPFAMTLGGGAGRWTRPIMLGVCMTSSLVYFWAGVGLLSFHPLAVALLNARNALLLGLFGIMVFAREST